MGLYVTFNPDGSIRDRMANQQEPPATYLEDDDPRLVAFELGRRQEARCDEVDALHALKAKHGFLHGGDRFEADAESYGKITALVSDAIACDRNMDGAEWEATAFVSATNRPLLLNSVGDVIAFGTAAKKAVKALFAKRFALKVAIRASADPESIDIEAGWPGDDN